MSTRGVSLRKILTGFRLALDSPGTLIRGGLTGTLIGAIPGVGSSVSNLVSYSETKRASRNPESFGKGNPQGVAASESANSSSEGGSRSEEHTSELQSLMRISYAVFCLQKKTKMIIYCHV